MTKDSDSFKWIMLAQFWLLYFTFGMIRAALSPLIAPISQELALTNSQIGTILGIFMIARASIPLEDTQQRLFKALPIRRVLDDYTHLSAFGVEDSDMGDSDDVEIVDLGRARVFVAFKW